MQAESVTTVDSSVRRRRPQALVVADLPPEEASAPIDWSAWYLTDEEDMGEGADQSDILSLLLAALHELAFERGWKDVYVSGNNFFAWVPGEPLVRVSPDAYLMDNPPPPPRPGCFQTWLPGHHPPRWALEVVSDDWRKDYRDNPPKYAQLGVKELVIFDPDAARAALKGEEAPVVRPARKGVSAEARVPFQLYRRGQDGALVLQYAGAGPVHSEELGAWLVTVPEGAAARVRIARDAAGKDLVPSSSERARAAEDRIRALEAELARRRDR